MKSFNLIHEKWIPCFLLNGKYEDLSLNDIFRNATKIKEIESGSPLVNISLYRFLLAILHRNFGPSDIDEWIELWEKEEFDFDKTQKYLLKFENRFDLFDKEHPFYQSNNINGSKKEDIYSLFLEYSYGNNNAFFDHSHEKNEKYFDFKDCAIALITSQNYGRKVEMSGIINYGNLYDGTSIIMDGNNLKDILVLNMMFYDISEDDIPIWEKDNENYEDKIYYDGYLDYLTYQNRFIKLIENEGNSISKIFIKQNKLIVENKDLDPFFSYKKIKTNDQKDEIVRYNIKKDVSSWRDYNSIFGIRELTIKPKIIKQISEIIAKYRKISSNKKIKDDIFYKTSIFGISHESGIGKSKINIWRQEKLPISFSIIENEILRDCINNIIDYSEKIENILHGSIRYFSSMVVKKDNVKSFTNSIYKVEFYWHSLEIKFYEILIKLSEENKIDIINEWQSFVMKIAKESLELSIKDMDYSAKYLKASCGTRQYFYGKINKLIR
jgi:CRISPR system Cascade subunit CasA